MTFSFIVIFICIVFFHLGCLCLFLLILVLVLVLGRRQDKLAKFFEEDSDLVQRRAEAQLKKDRLSKANVAMANIQVKWPWSTFR